MLAAVSCWLCIAWLSSRPGLWWEEGALAELGGRDPWPMVFSRLPCDVLDKSSRVWDKWGQKSKGKRCEFVNNESDTIQLMTLEVLFSSPKCWIVLWQIVPLLQPPHSSAGSLLLFSSNCHIYMVSPTDRSSTHTWKLTVHLDPFRLWMIFIIFEFLSHQLTCFFCLIFLW